ncbi:MAG: COP23 domain-containing protein [Hormoscilla sp. GUM202]|nr:COP23 domain-containing protein [Hormoscilla sp. GUM202]
MKDQSFIAILAAAALAIASSSCSKEYPTPTEIPPPSASGWKFICREGKKNGKLLPPTTYAWRPEGKKALVRWEKDVFEAMGYPAKTRCEQVSPRFQEAYDNETLNYMTNGSWKGKNGKEQPVICAASVEGGDCETLLFTLRHKDDSKQILDQLNEVIQGSSSKPVGHDSGVSDQIYIKVDLEEFLRNAPDE